jgi:hypothetical protein
MVEQAVERGIARRAIKDIIIGEVFRMLLDAAFSYPTIVRVVGSMLGFLFPGSGGAVIG